MKKFIVAAFITLAAFMFATGFTPYDESNYFFAAEKTAYQLLQFSDPEETDQPTAGASAVAFAPGRALSAAHVFMMGSDNWYVVNYDGEKLPVTVEYINASSDVAIISVPGLTCPCASIAKRAPYQYQELFTIGFPKGVPFPFLTEGRYQGTAEWAGTSDFFFSSVETASGNSGGGVFGVEDGRLVVYGTVYGVLADRIGLGPFRAVTVGIYHLNVSSTTENVKRALLCADGIDPTGWCEFE